MRKPLQTLFDLLRARWDSDDPASVGTLMRMLAEHAAPVSVQQWSAATGNTEDYLLGLLAPGKIDIDDGKMIDDVLGFTVNRSTWRLLIEGRELASCCPLVANTVARVTGKTVSLAPSVPYPGLDRDIPLDGGASLDNDDEPAGYQVSFAAVDAAGFHADLYNNVCRHLRVWTDEMAARQFIDDDPRRFLVGASEFNAFTRDLAAAAFSR